MLLRYYFVSTVSFYDINTYKNFWVLANFRLFDIGFNNNFRCNSTPSNNCVIILNPYCNYIIIDNLKYINCINLFDMYFVLTCTYYVEIHISQLSTFNSYG